MIAPELLRKIRQIEIRTRRLVSDSLSGQYHSVFKGRGMNFDEVREYHPGDDIRFIDWNVTARMNQPFIKKFIEERELTVMLLVDLSASGRFGSRQQSKRELAAEVASVLAYSAINNQDKVGLILFTETVEKYIPPGKGNRHVLRVVRDILCHRPRDKGTRLESALEFLSQISLRKGIVILISDFLGPIHLTALRRANRRHDVVAVQIQDRYEQQLPSLGRLLLEDAETSEVVEIDTSREQVRQRFAAAQTGFDAQLEQQFNGLGIDRIQIQTDESYIAALARFFVKREKRRLRR